MPVLPRTLNGKKCEIPIKRILAGADPDSVISRDALADPVGFAAFLQAAVNQSSLMGARPAPFGDQAVGG